MLQKKAERWLSLFLALTLCALSLLIYMRFEFKNITLTFLDSHEPSIKGVKIVYAVDFQYDLAGNDEQSFERETFQKAIDLILAQNPDIILLGGDYITYASNCDYAVPYLLQLQAPLGVYGVFGNHDNRAKDKFIEQLPNIRFLQNDRADIPYNGVEIAVYGVEDLWMGKPVVSFEPRKETAYSVLLTHNPDYFEQLSQAERDVFDLALAGHIHAGQITLFGVAGIPLVLGTVTDYGERYRYGEKTYFGNRIFVSSGLGGKIYRAPIRFGARPEIVVIQ